VKLETVTVPDLGGATEVEVIEIGVAVGEAVSVDQPLITLESEKASMEVPAPLAGTVAELCLKVGDRVRQGDAMLKLALAGAAVQPGTPVEEAAPGMAGASGANAAQAPAPPARFVERRTTPRAALAADSGPEVVVEVPDLGGAESVEVIEISVRAGDRVTAGAPLLVMESDKASMELPAPVAGVVESVEVRVGARISGGQRVAVLRAAGDAERSAPVVAASTPAAPAVTPPAAPVAASTPLAEGDGGSAIARVLEKERHLAGAARRESAAPELPYAGPAVRQLARELGVVLVDLRGTGPKGRILKEDVQRHVKERLAAPRAGPGTGVPPLPEVDFAAFGPVELLALGGIQKATVTSMARSWLNVPHVTQFDHADVTELEAFRESLKPEMEQRGNKLTPLPFLLLACARALREHPRFNASLHADGAQLVMKQYCHIGVAVDTPQGLVVPVIRDVDRKSLWELAAEARELAAKARARKLKLAEMQGACFTISSLGPIGGEGFTPIVNAPEVAILGVSRLAVRPVWDGKAFQPRKTLPLSLSYDHRVINGADAGAFLTWLVAVLGDVRRLLL
jgi:pyruvate dehydrogenase E2 component (dihydrolipoamide acetyltransferase)